MMDCDVERRQTRSGRMATRLVLLPDADISEPDNESDSDYEQAQSDTESNYNSSSDTDDVPLAQLVGDGSSSPAAAIDDDDDVPLVRIARKSSAETAKLMSDVGRTFRWRKMTPVKPDITWKGSFSNPPDIEEPIHYFRQFFCTPLLEDIVQQTNIYAVQCGSTFGTDLAEIEQYLGVLVKMGLVHMPRYKCYWSTELRFPAIADVMSRNRFSDLTRYIHFNDNSKAITNRDDPQHDRYYKVRPLLNKLREACLKIEPEENMSIDEQMIPFKGRNSLRQYLPKKPKKWGFKVLARSGVSGITYDFCLYDGKGPTVQQSCGYQSGDFVVKLCETLPKGQNFKVYFDNWFTFLELQIQLHSWGIWTIGTVRSNRLRGCTLKSEKELRKVGRGAADMSVDANSSLSVVRWLDNSVVQLSSTYSALEPMTSVKRWDRKQHKHVNVNCPAIVKEYNEHMGGVDLFDMLMSLYKVDHKSTTWYRRIFLWALNLAVINGWLVYRRHANQLMLPGREQMDLIHFTASISEALVQQNKLPPTVARRRGRPTSAASQVSSDTTSDGGDRPAQPKKRSFLAPAGNSARYDYVGHLPAHSEPKQRCKLCRSYVRMKCVKCGVHLCITKDKNCFIDYHTL